MSKTHVYGASSLPASDLYRDKRRLECTNELLAEEARLAKEALKIALDKLGFDWSPASRDYSIIRDVLAVTPLPEVERSLTYSEADRIRTLRTVTDMQQLIGRLLHERDDALIALTRKLPDSSYRCTYLDNEAVVIETELGAACWFIDKANQHHFTHLSERQPPARILSRAERTAAMLLLTLGEQVKP